MSLDWEVIFSKLSKKSFSKLGRREQKRILVYIKERVLLAPRDYGMPLKENLSGLWKYRVGDYRIICDIQDEKLIILVLQVGHRSEIYDTQMS